MKDIRMRRLTREVEAIQEIYKNTSLIIDEYKMMELLQMKRRWPLHYSSG